MGKMVLDVYAGNKFSRLKLIWETNRFFGITKFKRLIMDKSSNYVIKIGNNSVKIIISNNVTEEENIKIKHYIEKMFENHSILIESTKEIKWVDEIKNVSIRKMNNTK